MFQIPVDIAFKKMFLGVIICYGFYVIFRVLAKAQGAGPFALSPII